MQLENHKRDKKKDKINALFQATLLLVNTQGFHDAPMSKIAKKAGVSVGCIYLYFENKQDLINNLYLTIKAKYAHSIFDQHIQNKPIKDEIKMIWMHAVHFKINHPEEAFFLAQCDNTPMIDESIVAQGVKMLNPLIVLWERGIEQGVLKKVSNYYLYAFTLYPLNFILQSYKQGKISIDEEILEQAFEMVWDSIRKI